MKPAVPVLMKKLSANSDLSKGFSVLQVAHILYFFSEPGDLVLDPMAGGVLRTAQVGAAASRAIKRTASAMLPVTSGRQHLVISKFPTTAEVGMVVQNGIMRSNCSAQCIRNCNYSAR
jgi:hypothetical protein